MFRLARTPHLNKGFACELRYDVSALTLIYGHSKTLIRVNQRVYSLSLHGSLKVHHCELTIYARFRYPAEKLRVYDYEGTQECVRNLVISTAPVT